MVMAIVDPEEKAKAPLDVTLQDRRMLHVAVMSSPLSRRSWSAEFINLRRSSSAQS